MNQGVGHRDGHKITTWAQGWGRQRKCGECWTNLGWRPGWVPVVIVCLLVKDVPEINFLTKKRRSGEKGGLIQREGGKNRGPGERRADCVVKNIKQIVLVGALRSEQGWQGV